jgi:hypothetical protein
MGMSMRTLGTIKTSMRVALKVSAAGVLVMALTASDCDGPDLPAANSGTSALCHCDCFDVCYHRLSTVDEWGEYKSWCLGREPIYDNECGVCLGTTAQANPGQSCSDFCASLRVGYLPTESDGKQAWCRVVYESHGPQVSDLVGQSCTPPGPDVYGLSETSTNSGYVARAAQCDYRATVTEDTFIGPTRGGTPAGESESTMVYPAKVAVETSMSAANLTVMGIATGNVAASGRFVTVGGICPGRSCPITISSMSIVLPNASLQGHSLANARLQTSADIAGTMQADGSFSITPQAGALTLSADVDGKRTTFTLSGTISGRADVGAGEWHLAASLSASNANASLGFNVGGFTSPRKGDGNGDGKIAITDALVCSQFSQGLATTRVFPAACDVNCDGKVDGTDGNLIAQHAAGLITEFTCNPTP